MNFLFNIPLKKYAVSFIISLCLTLVLLSALSIIFSFLAPPSWLLDSFHNYIFIFSAFIAAFLCAKASSGRGFLTGIIASNLYILLLIALGGLVFKNSLESLSFVKIFIPGTICGAVGGILGINCK